MKLKDERIKMQEERINAKDILLMSKEGEVRARIREKDDIIVELNAEIFKLRGLLNNRDIST